MKPYGVLLPVLLAQTAYGSNLGDTLIAAVKTADDNEFLTPESVVREFFSAVISGEIDRSTRCFPIHSLYSEITFTKEIEKLGVFNYSTTPLPGDGFARFQKAIGGHAIAVAKIRSSVLIKSEEEILELLNGKIPDLRDAEGKLSQERIQALRKRLDVTSLKGVTIESLSVISSMEQKSLRGLNVESVSHLSAILRVGESEINSHGVFLQQPQISRSLQFGAKLHPNYSLERIRAGVPRL